MRTVQKPCVKLGHSSYSAFCLHLYVYAYINMCKLYVQPNTYMCAYIAKSPIVSEEGKILFTLINSAQKF